MGGFMTCRHMPRTLRPSFWSPYLLIISLGYHVTRGEISRWTRIRQDHTCLCLPIVLSTYKPGVSIKKTTTNEGCIIRNFLACSWARCIQNNWKPAAVAKETMEGPPLLPPMCGPTTDWVENTSIVHWIIQYTTTNVSLIELLAPCGEPHGEVRLPIDMVW